MRDRYHNTSVVFDREGEEIARYRKIHMFDMMTPDGTEYKESATVKAGEAGGHLRLRRRHRRLLDLLRSAFPELFQALDERGAR